ncbi:MAG: YigZ family protein [Acidobacteriota bacterium]
MATIRSVARPLRHEIDKIKGSRFLGTVTPVETRDAAAAALDELRVEFREATHNCYAWRVGTDPEAKRASDDGEPSGTAGRPILQEIDGRRLTNVLVVVTRWYGGTKLGTGGLLRAYSAAASEALDRVEIVERPIVEVLGLRFGYGVTGPVQGVLSAHGLEPLRADYGAEVAMELAVPVEAVETVRHDLVEATHGTIDWVGTED